MKRGCRVGRAALWLFGCALLTACNPFSSVTTDQGFTVSDGDGPKVELLTERRRLPKSATRIAGHVLHFQDTILSVRFDAPLVEAKAFRQRMLEGKGRACVSWPTTTEIEDWPAEAPPGADCLEDRTVDEVEPPITVAVVPRGKVATIYVQTFG